MNQITTNTKENHTMNNNTKENKMNELTFKEIKSEIRLSHRVLAEHMGLRQGDVRDLIERHIALFEQISPCPFETEMVELGLGTKREVKVYYLDSDQANFLIGLTRPTEDTLPLKLNVVMAFKKAKEQLANKSPMRIPQTFAEALRLAADAAEAADRAEAARIIAQEQEAIAVAERNKAVEKVQRVVPALLTLKSQQQRKESLMVGQFAKELSDDQGYEIGERRLFALLRERGWICKRSSEPTQKAIEHDFMAIRRSAWKHPTKGEQTSIVPLITTKGQIKLHEILTSSGVRKRTQQDILHSEYDDSFESLMCELGE